MLPSAIQLLNGLPLETKCIESFHTFKNVLLKKPVAERTKNVKIFYYGSRRENITYCQLRHIASFLKWRGTINNKVDGRADKRGSLMIKTID